MIYVSDHEYTQKHDIQMSLYWPRIQGGAGLELSLIFYYQWF